MREVNGVPSIPHGLSFRRLKTNRENVSPLELPHNYNVYNEVVVLNQLSNHHCPELSNKDFIQGYGASSFSLAWVSVYRFVYFIRKIKIKPKEFLKFGE